MYSGVPNTARVTVSLVTDDFSTFEMPKSTTFTNTSCCGTRVKNTLPGLRSRWTTPSACATASAEATCLTIGTAVSIATRLSRSRRRSRSSPSRYSITRYGTPEGVTPKSTTWTMCGCSSALVTLTSRRKRASASG